MVKLDEELSKLPPEERIKRIDEYKRQRQDELEQLKKHGENTEKEIRKSIEDSILEDDLEKKQDDEARERTEIDEAAQILEKTVEQERPPPPEETSQTEYHIAGQEGPKTALDIYQVAGQETKDELYRLRDMDHWSNQDIDSYNSIKSGLDKVTHYQNLNETIQEQLDANIGVLKSMGYAKRQDYRP